jgi:hypothetical protein
MCRYYWDSLDRILTYRKESTDSLPTPHNREDNGNTFIPKDGFERLNPIRNLHHKIIDILQFFRENFR